MKLNATIRPTRILIIAQFIIPIALAFSGCITYYKPDPFSGLNLARRVKSATVDVSLNRYDADSWFDGEGQVPHTSKDGRPERKYIREEIILRGSFGISDRAHVVVVLPVSHVVQKDPSTAGSGTNEWGIEHAWIGLNVGFTDRRRFSVLFAMGIPMSGAIGNLYSADESHNNSLRWTLQPTLTNGLLAGRFGYYLRLGLVVHANPGRESVSGVYELPGELMVLAPLGSRLLAGMRADAEFTIIDYNSSRGWESRDAIAFGPYISYAANDEWLLYGGYRSEVIGFRASAGSSWQFGVARDFNFFANSR